MTEEAIADTIDAYAAAAAAARSIGFDALELHGAHGYLIDQFLWGRVNQRTDRWGGATIGERARFAVEVVKAVRAQLGEMPLILRLSQWKIRHYEVRLTETPDEMRAWLEPLAEAGVDIFHCSQRRFWEPEFAGSDLNFAGWAKKLTGRATVAVGSIGLDNPEQRAFSGVSSWTIEEAARRVERGEFDLVAVGRAMIASADWANKVREGRIGELAAFDPVQLSALL
jgi:2,4-dienoyl-CoA reductase-like NADH-dependent reductase (Old Yellow Enzyme family)